jgi:hypothetical protein
MPFDGVSLSPTLRLLGRLIEFFEDENTWCIGELYDGNGRACLLGALRFTRRELGIKGDSARPYLMRAIRQNHRCGSIYAFNDCFCSGIEELRDTIRFAHALAAIYPPDGLPRPPAKPAGYTASRKPSVLGLAHLEVRSGSPPAQLELLFA